MPVIMEMLPALESNWSFVAFLLFSLILFGRWRVVLITLCVIALGYGAEDMVITNVHTSHEVVSVPLLVYCAGGAMLILFSLVSFIGSAIR